MTLKRSTKLTLRRDTLRHLEQHDLEGAVGGAPQKSYSCKVGTCESRRLSCITGPCTIDTIIDL